MVAVDIPIYCRDYTAISRMDMNIEVEIAHPFYETIDGVDSAKTKSSVESTTNKPLPLLDTLRKRRKWTRKASMIACNCLENPAADPNRTSGYLSGVMG